MPITQFICPATREKVPLDHFDHCRHRNGRAAYSPFLAAAIVNNALEDVRHASWGMTATTMSGCVKAKVFAHLCEFALDPTKRTKMQRGTELHARAVAALRGRPGWYVESDSMDLTAVAGRLFKGVFDPLTYNGVEIVNADGLLVVTSIDAINTNHPGCEHINWKFPSDFSVRSRSVTGKAKHDHVAQLNVERLLVEQQPWAAEIGYGVEAPVMLSLWDHAVGQGETGQPLGLDAPHKDETWILEHKPGVDPPGEKYYNPDAYAQALSTKQIIELWLAATEEMAGAKTRDAREKVVCDVPCNGAVMFGGKGCLEYCDVSAQVKDLEMARERAGGV